VTTPRHLIAPSILSADFGRLAEEIRAVDEAGADWIHVDVMDGHFVPNLTIGPAVIKAARAATSLPLDVHLMIESPDAFIDRYAEAGADRIAVHVEACTHLHRTVAQVREAGARAGVALNPATPAAAIEPILGDVDQVVVMTVNPGFGGQKFIESVLPKISQIRRWIDERELAVELEVDGGVGPGSIGRVARAGANAFVAGSAIFHKPDYAATIAELRKEAAG
jgi:ribulose-phosphate 3-epimerase